jgi:hypothetical protein
MLKAGETDTVRASSIALARLGKGEIIADDLG